MAKISKKEATKQIQEWFESPYLEKTKNWNKLLPYINAYKDVYIDIAISRKPKKSKEEDLGKEK